MTFQEFVQAANAKYNNKYTYIEDTFSFLHVPMTIICPEHGVFKQAPTYHLKHAKCGCPQCGILSRPPRKVTTADGRIGKTNTNTKGYKMQCTNYRKCDDIDVTFLHDGSVVRTTWALFCKGKVSHPDDSKARGIVNPWTDKDYDILKAKFPTQGSNIPELLARHSKVAIQGQASKLGIRCVSSFAPWTFEENEILRENYASVGPNIPELLEHHSRDAIIKHAQKLNVHSHAPRSSTWTDEQIEILKKDYPEKGTKIPELTDIFTSMQIRSKANTLGISYQNDAKWTKEELDILRQKYTKTGPQIPELMERHSVSGIRRKASQLGLVFRKVKRGDLWTAEEEAILREKYPVLGCNIPELSHRAPESIKARACKLKIQKRIKWSKEQEQILIKKYPVQYAEIPELLQYYTKTQIRGKASTLGVTTRKMTVSPWTDREIQILKQKYETNGTNIPELRSKRSKASIINQARVLGIKTKKPYEFDSKIGDSKLADNGFTVTIKEFISSGRLVIAYPDGSTIKIFKRQWIENNIPLPPADKSLPNSYRGIGGYKLSKVTEAGGDVYYAVENLNTGEKNILSATAIEAKIKASK